MAVTNKTFRIFVSSTFSDLKAERNALEARVFPRLRQLCAAHGAQFQPIDLRWGVSEYASLDQRAMGICLEEITRCQIKTPRPNFIVLLGDRYGWRPIPSQIPANRYEEIDHCINHDERRFLNDWYLFDSNALYKQGNTTHEGVYILQPREGRFVDYETWYKDVELPLNKIIQRAVTEMTLTEVEKNGYVASATHQEITAGALNVQESDKHVFCFFRSIDGLPNNFTASEFLDLGSDGSLDEDAAFQLNKLKSTLKDRLTKNVFEYSAAWRGDGITQDHIGQLTEDVYRSLANVIENELAQSEGIDSLDKEISDHRVFGNLRAVRFVGRTKPQSAILSYLNGQDPRLLCITGEEGIGKSALIAKAFQQSSVDFPDSALISRHIGATPASVDGRVLLEGLCIEISRYYGLEEFTIPTIYPALAKAFSRLLKSATRHKPLMIFLDGLDQIPKNDPAHDLGWLPRLLPQHVRLVVTTLDGEPLNIIQNQVPKVNKIALEEMSMEEAEEVINCELAYANRTVQADQRAKIHLCIEQNRLPLYLHLLSRDICKWRSYTPITDPPLQVSDIIQQFISNLSEETENGKVLVSHVVSYLFAAKDGLSEDELLDILSKDDEVIRDFKRRSPNSPETNRLPVIVWSRLRADLEPYFVEVKAENTLLLKFFHRQFSDVLKDTFLQSTDMHNFHLALADYFWEQPRSISIKDTTSPNLRKFNELIHHLLICGQADRLDQLVKDGFLEEKASVLGAYATLQEVRSIAALLAAEGDNYQDGLLKCAYIYSDLTAMVSEKPESIRILAENGNIRALLAVVDGERDEAFKKYLLLAAGAFLSAAGHAEKAEKLFQLSRGFRDDEIAHSKSDKRLQLSRLGKALERKISLPTTSVVEITPPEPYQKAVPRSMPETGFSSNISTSKIIKLHISTAVNISMVLATIIVIIVLFMLEQLSFLSVVLVICFVGMLTALVGGALHTHLRDAYMHRTVDENEEITLGLMAAFHKAPEQERVRLLGQILRFQDMIEDQVNVRKEASNGKESIITWSQPLRLFLSREFPFLVQCSDAVNMLAALTMVPGLGENKHKIICPDDLIRALRSLDVDRLTLLLTKWYQHPSWKPQVKGQIGFEILAGTSDLVYFPEAVRDMVAERRFAPEDDKYGELLCFPDTCLAEAILLVYRKVNLKAYFSPAELLDKIKLQGKRLLFTSKMILLTALSNVDRISSFLKEFLILFFILLWLVFVFIAPALLLILVFVSPIILFLSGSYISPSNQEKLPSFKETTRLILIRQPDKAEVDIAITLLESPRAGEAPPKKSSLTGGFNDEFEAKRAARVLKKLVRSGVAPSWSNLVLRTMHNRSLLDVVSRIPEDRRQKINMREVTVSDHNRQSARMHSPEFLPSLVLSLVLILPFITIWAEALWRLDYRTKVCNPSNVDILCGFLNNLSGENYFVMSILLALVFVIIQHSNLPRAFGSKAFNWFIIIKSAILTGFGSILSPFLLFGPALISYFVVPEFITRWRGGRILYPTNRRLWQARVYTILVSLSFCVLLAFVAVSVGTNLVSVVNRFPKLNPSSIFKFENADENQLGIDLDISPTRYVLGETGLITIQLENMNAYEIVIDNAILEFPNKFSENFIIDYESAVPPIRESKEKMGISTALYFGGAPILIPPGETYTIRVKVTAQFPGDSSAKIFVSLSLDSQHRKGFANPPIIHSEEVELVILPEN